MIRIISFFRIRLFFAVFVSAFLHLSCFVPVVISSYPSPCVPACACHLVPVVFWQVLCHLCLPVCHCHCHPDSSLKPTRPHSDSNHSTWESWVTVERIPPSRRLECGISREHFPRRHHLCPALRGSATYAGRRHPAPWRDPRSSAGTR